MKKRKKREGIIIHTGEIEKLRVFVCKMMQTQRTLENQQSMMQSGQISGSLSFNGALSKEDEEMSKSALSTFRAKEEEIEKKKLEVRDKVQAQLGRIEEETKRLATIREVFFSTIFYFIL